MPSMRTVRLEPAQVAEISIHDAKVSGLQCGQRREQQGSEEGES